MIPHSICGEQPSGSLSAHCMGAAALARFMHDFTAEGGPDHRHGDGPSLQNSVRTRPQPSPLSARASLK